MSDDLPYLVEYAKSSRGSCQNCKLKIEKDVLRIAAMIQSPFHDGKIPKWYHSSCFFLRQRPASTADIANFDNIRWEDQEDVKKSLEQASKTPLPAGKGRKRASTKAVAGGASGDFQVQYAKSGQAMCRGCEEKIAKEEVRVAKKDYESDDAKRYGGLDRWYHLECFAKLRSELGYFESGDTLPGANSLSKEDKALVKKTLPKIKAEDPPQAKKMKSEPEDAEEEAEMKKQNKELFSIRDSLSSLQKQQLIELLEKNKQEVPQGTSAILDRLADAVCFGTLQPCPKCKGQLVYTSGLGYKCTGDLTEWTKCEYVTQDPSRKKFVIPSHMKEEIPSSIGKLKVKRRLIKVVAPSTSSAVKKEDAVDAGPKIQGKPKPLKFMKFVIVGNTKKDKDELKKEIQLLGGSVTTKIDDTITAVIANQKELDRMGKRIETAQDFDIHVITEDFIEEAKEYTLAATTLIKKKTISSWGGDINAKITDAEMKSTASRGKSKFEKSGSGKVKLQVKEGGTVDPDSELQDVAHIYYRGKERFSATLGLTDIQSHKNSYYKLQLLEHDKKKKYWLFRSWGRIGTSIGGHKIESLSLEEAIEQFRNLYEEKSGNTWDARDYFVKVPGRMYPIDVDHGEDENSSKLLESNIKSNLKEPVQELMRLIFDVESMRKVMLEFEIDMDKLPLGKLSKKQIQKAYAVLTELQDLLKNSNPEKVLLIDATNRFFTLIPHSFGIAGPPILDNNDLLQEKCQMLDALLDMEVAYNLLHGKTDSNKNPLDGHYEQLKTEIDVLNADSEEYKIIDQYIKNTHAETHSHYKLKIEDVFSVKRQGEDKRYKPFKKLQNRKLLWHGSRTTNFAGILSQGLRIAPPEAPVTGYMFGKGIYFADMVSKSANYCCTNTQNPTGLLLLCEVALGNMYERYHAEYIEKPPKGMHSTFGRGQTVPDPNVEHKLPGDVVVPCGPPVKSELKKKSALLYNEYIVYDVAQVQAKYLVKVNFDYKS